MEENLENQKKKKELMMWNQPEVCKISRSDSSDSKQQPLQDGKNSELLRQWEKDFHQQHELCESIWNKQTKK